MKRTPLKKMGRDKARETRKYWPLRGRFLSQHEWCEFPVQGYPQACTHFARQIHHIKGQHWKIMNDTKWWMALCPIHHAWIHDHANEARKRGLIL